MKKLFALAALLTCFMGVNAKTVVDAEQDFSQYTDISQVQFASWRGSDSAFARLSIQDGCLHFESTEATDPSWDCQFFPIGGVDAEVDVTYTLHFKIKGDHEGKVSMLGFGQTPYNQFQITTDWVEGTVEYIATNNDGNILMQCGDWIGSWDIAYLKITHEEADDTTPIQWENIVTNSGADEEWDSEMKAGDEGWENIVAWSKEWGFLMEDVNADAGDVAIPRPHPAFIEDGVFVCHAKKVEPIMYYITDGKTSWGSTWAAGDQMPDNTWQNQFWINYPRAMKAGEQIKISFRYKASEAVTVTTQDHQNHPGDYLGGGTVGNLNFGTEWATFEKTISAAEGAHSLCFNVTGENDNWKRDLDFYFDDITVSTMVLDEGFFVASADIEDGYPEYKFSTATEMVYDEEEDAYVATVGTKGQEDTWVNQIMISTVRGNDKAFKSACLKTSGDPHNDEWTPIAAGSNGKINLPARGVWTVMIGIEEDETMMFKCVQVEGEEIVVREPLEEIPNPTEIVVHGQERDDLSDTFKDGERTGREGEGGTGETWDNQFFIVANRTLAKDEETVIKFKFRSSIDALTTTQLHGEPGGYLHWDALGEVNFVGGDVWQNFEKELKIPAEADGMKSIAFNMAEIKEACDYYIKDVVWMTKDRYETLIDTEGTKNFYVKEGAGTAPYEFGNKPEPTVDGDVNGDGAIDVADISAVISQMAGTEAYEKADVNNDGAVDVADISNIITIMAESARRAALIGE